MSASGSQKRRQKGEGSITKLKDGRWMGRYTIVLSDGTKKRQPIVSKNREEVIQKMRSEMAMAGMGTPILHDKRTVGQYLEYWMRYILPNLVLDSTLELYKHAVYKHILPRIGTIPLTQLKPEHVRMMINGMQTDRIGLRTIQRVRNTLSAALREALKLEYVTRNVAKLVDAPKYKSPEKKTWSKEEVLQFLRHAKSHKYYPLFLLLLTYGLRRGEALGLRWQDIDFENNVIKIRQACYLLHHKPHFGAPKTVASIRDLPMLPHIKSVLMTHFETTKRYDDDLIFHTKNDLPVNPKSLLKTFRSLAQQAKLPPLSIHEARHTAATLLVQAWSSPKEAQNILGHSSITTTLQIYAHTNMQRKEEALNKMAQNLFQAEI